MTVDLSGKGNASEADIKAAASDLMDILRSFDSPKDAVAALALAHYRMIQACFGPEDKLQAFAYIDAESKCVKDLVSLEWN